MKNKFIKFSVTLFGSLGLLIAGTAGVAGASSISNTGPGSYNRVSGSSGSIDTTGPHSVNVIGDGCHQGCNGCGSGCVKEKEECPPPPPKEKDCDKKERKHVKHHTKWCWKLCGHTWKWCQVQV